MLTNKDKLLHNEQELKKYRLVVFDEIKIDVFASLNKEQIKKLADRNL